MRRKRRPVIGSYRRRQVIDDMQSLGYQYAIKRAGRNLGSTGQIANNGCLRIVASDVEDVAPGNPCAAEPLGIRAVLNLEDMTVNVGVAWL